ncbi:MAG TPA: class I SAM-dependent methyltransferase [Candidatus Andersenbacteria bacterium]|nr:class I SAM-dependent methyltransferase [Candidatus Andersenbacteria bacterium]
MNTDYATYFAKFLQHTNEKPVFIKEISGIIRARWVASMLDIGAGNGELSVPLSKFVREYMAVEHNPSHIIALEKAGLTVIPEKFPCRIPGEFDFVLASHVLSYQAENQSEFLALAFEKVKARGALLVITFRSHEQNEWTNLIERLDMPVHEQYSSGFAALVNIVRDITDDYVIRKVRTEVRTDTFDDMAQALAFVASDGVTDAANTFLERREKLKALLDEKYRQGSQFVFPFDHFFIQIAK